MVRPTTLALVLVSACALPLIALAAPPASVTGLGAEELSDGAIKVSWKLVEGDVRSYRVYYSQKSILQNNGYYDDVETTDGPASAFILQAVPASFPEVYIAAMAVNAQGEESGYFVEEVRVQRTHVTSPSSAPSPSLDLSGLPGLTPPTSSFSPIATPPPPQISPPVSSVLPRAENTLRLISVQALSATRVGLLFSVPPIIVPEQAPQAFSIADAAGNLLPIEQLTIEGTNATLQTARQTAGMVYQVRLSEPLTGEGNVPLDAIDRTSFFTGHTTGLSAQEAQLLQQQQQPTPTPAPQQTPQETCPPSTPGTLQGPTQITSTLPDVVNYRLYASPQKNQLFTIIGEWELDPATPEGAFIVVRQSRDGGRTFGKPEFLPKTVDGVRVPSITPENFGIVVYVVDAVGGSSPGVFRSVFAWNTPPSASSASSCPTVQQKTSSSSVSSQNASLIAPPTPKAKRLTQTGTGTMAGVVMLGIALGWRRARKNKA